MGSERAAALADDLAAANEDALSFARSCSDGEWTVTVPGEGWGVGVVLHHIAEGHADSARWLRSMACGEGVTESAEDIDRANEAHALRAGACSPAETVALLRANGDLLEATLRGLGDEELDRRAPFGPASGRELATVDLAAVAARHTREHLAHAVGAVGRPR